MMRVSDEERLYIKDAIAIADRIGYGNLLAHIASAWAAKENEERKKRGLPEIEDVVEFSGDLRALPVLMHKDIIDRGEWDETGKRYRKKAKKDGKK